jgi:outer membrane murein-binding lipoprotein Lpp
MDQQRTQIDEYQNENQRLEENVEWLRTQVTAYQRENQQLNEQLRQNDAQVTFENSQSGE